MPGLRDPLPRGGCAKLHREALLQVADRVTPLRESAFCGGGDGIITVGGGMWWPMIVVQIRMLREVGCKLPVEVWHRGSCEPIEYKDVMNLGPVEIHNVESIAACRGDARIIGGWEQKLYALTHTRLDRVLFLDADAYCVRDPVSLFDHVNHTGGFLHWSDMPHQDRTIKWSEVFGRSLPLESVQGGQFVIDRERRWNEIQVAHWICQHSDHYWDQRQSRSDWLLYGDQDAWRLAFAATGFTPRSLGRARWQDVAFVCEYGTEPYIVHRCQGKMMRMRDRAHLRDTRINKPYYNLPLEARVFDHLAYALRDESDGDPAAVFEAIYRSEAWDGGSGAGSTDAESVPYAAVINALARTHKWKSCVDLGCGDGRVARMLAFDDYVGLECSQLALDRLIKLDPNRIAVKHNFMTYPHEIPAADVLLCKDVLHHWPSSRIREWLSHILSMKQRWKAVILTQDGFQQHDGQDCHLGGYRALRSDWEPLAGFPLTKLADYLHKSIYLLGEIA